VQVKFGAPFAEHSPILNDISELPTWARVNEGLAKMYKTELLGKLPVVQVTAGWVVSLPPFKYGPIVRAALSVWFPVSRDLDSVSATRAP
jgi:hypothetical protein